MQKYLYAITFLFFLCHVEGQELESRRTIRPYRETADTVLVKVKYSKDKIIQYLEQEYYTTENENTYLISETYKRNKYWVVHRFKENVLKDKKHSTVLNYVTDGPQYSFNEDGRLESIEQYIDGTMKGFRIFYKYYENGQLKLKAEIKEDKVWNYLVYQYPDGSDYTDFGDYKNGKGTVIHLDETGSPCIECVTIKKKAKGKAIGN